MKILHIGEYVKGGVYTYINQLAMLQNREHDVYVMASRLNSELKFDIDPDKLYFYDYRRHPKHFFKAIKQYREIINQIQPDIIHLHSTFAGFLCRVLFFLKKPNAKIVYCPHGWAFTMETSSLKKRLYALIERVLAIKTDFIINISQKEQESAIKFGIPKNRMVMIYNGVSEAISAEPIEVDKGKINILFIGRWDRQKGIDLLFETIKIMQSDNYQFHIIGEKVLGDSDSVDIPHNVKCYGWVGNHEIDKYYKACDVIVIPSRWEGFGLVAIEAMRNKKPVIASDRGSLPEIIKHSENGLIFNLAYAPPSLLGCFYSLNHMDLLKMGIRGYEIYKEKFTIEILHNKIIELYETVISNQHR